MKTSRTKQFFKKSETRFGKRKTAEDNNAKINVFPNILVPFCSSEIVHFFPKNLLFGQVLKMSVFLKSKCLKTSNKRTHIPLSINQIVSLIEVKM